MKRNLTALLKSCSGKDIIITNTFEEDSFGFNLAHVLRTKARKTFCIDSRYKMSKEKEGYREIEEGKVVLIKADFDKEKERVYEIIKQFGGYVSAIIDIK